MTVDELKDVFRRDVKDLVESGDTDADALWSDDDIYGYMDTAQKAFARLTECFLDSSTYTLLPVTANDPWVTHSPRILRVHHAILNTLGRELELKKFTDMASTARADDYGSSFSSWQGSSWLTRKGRPQYLVTNADRLKWRLAPIPEAADTLWVIVTRLPLEDITDESSELEITEIEEQGILLDSMKAQAYMKQDADTYDSDLSKKFEGSFNASCAQIKRNYDQSRHTAGVVRYGGL